MFGQTVTLYHRTGAAEGGAVTEQWVRMVLEGVLFDASFGERATSRGPTADAHGLLLIPFEGHQAGYVPPALYSGEGWTVAEGDRVVEGALDYEVGSSPSELRAFGRVGTVTAVRPMPFGGLPHWEIRCDGARY